MRIINADDLIIDARFGEDEIPFVSLEQIEGAPEVDAIPIDFINKVIEDKRYIWEFASPETGKYYENAVRALQSLLWEWEKEKATNQ